MLHHFGLFFFFFWKVGKLREGNLKFRGREENIWNLWEKDISVFLIFFCAKVGN